MNSLANWTLLEGDTSQSDVTLYHSFPKSFRGEISETVICRHLMPERFILIGFQEISCSIQM